jgi:alpha-beta hydrolase superfamily lysophospholipase
MKVILIHGIHSPEKNNNISKLKPALERAMPGVEIEIFSYGFMGFWAARWENEGIAQKFSDAICEAKTQHDKVVVISHSNGGAITYLAVNEFDADPDMVIQINPALDNYRTPVVKWVEVIHSEQDRAVELAQWLPFNIWGNQGKVGYKGKRKNTINHDASKFDKYMRYDDHTGLFEDTKIDMWARFMANRITGMLQTEYADVQ